MRLVLHMLIYRVKLTEPATISTSYKTAATPHVSMMTLDPKRLDGKLCQFIYEPNANGAGDLKPGYWPVFEKDEENSLWVTVADRAELRGGICSGFARRVRVFIRFVAAD